MNNQQVDQMTPQLSFLYITPTCPICLHYFSIYSMTWTSMMKKLSVVFIIIIQYIISNVFCILIIYSNSNISWRRHSSNRLHNIRMYICCVLLIRSVFFRGIWDWNWNWVLCDMSNSRQSDIDLWQIFLHIVYTMGEENDI